MNAKTTQAIRLTTKDIHSAYEGWYYTILGCGGDLNEWMNGYADMLKEEGIGEIKQWYKTTGKVLNERYELRGKMKFKQSLVILMFPIDGLDVKKLSMFKIKMGDRWFTDIIDNSVSYGCVMSSDAKTEQ